MPITRKMFHTQEYRLPYLATPLICNRDDAWIGKGYYFWYEEMDAIAWGQESKKRYHKYVIYTADIDFEDVLDTVFNEEHYLFWYKIIDRIADDAYKKTGRKPTIAEVNEIIKIRNSWKAVKGIMFQDLPNNPTLNKVIILLYRKRIQLVAFDLNIIHNFAFHFEAEC
jgi:hypothetical protein